MSKQAALPKPFKDLEPYADWALATETERMVKRFATGMEDIKAYYEVMIARIEDILDHLDEFDLDNLPEAERNLLNMSLSLVEVANAVEVYGLPASPYSCGPTRFENRIVDVAPPSGPLK